MRRGPNSNFKYEPPDFIFGIDMTGIIDAKGPLKPDHEPQTERYSVNHDVYTRQL